MPTIQDYEVRASEYLRRRQAVATENATNSQTAVMATMVEPDDPKEPVTLPLLVDLLLKDQRRLDRIAREAARQRELVPWYLAVGLIGYTVFGVALALVFSAADAWPTLTPMREWLASPGRNLISFSQPGSTSALSHWWNGDALALVAAFDLGMIGAIGVCLPSFYFYGLLAGVSTSMLQVTTHALKGLAAGAVAVVGVLPIYVAIILGVVVIRAPEWIVHATCSAGLLLPFIAGLWGTRALYVGFVALAATMPAERRARRAGFLRRLLFSWSACFTTVTPLMIFTLWEYFGR